MHSILQTYLVANLGADFPATETTKNIYPRHIPDNALSNTRPLALVYNIISSQVNLTQYLYQVQLTVYGLNYGDCRAKAEKIVTLFNEKQYSGGANDFLATSVSDIVELDYDPDPQVYGVAVNITIKSRMAL
jgi:hypothetical protein